MMEIFVKVTPNAKINQITEDKLDIFGARHLKVKVNQPPEDGKANTALVNVLSEYFNVKKNEIKITQGLTSRSKIIKIYNKTNL